MLTIMAVAFACTIPSALLMQRVLKEEGVHVSLDEAPPRYLATATKGQKAFLIGLNVVIAAAVVVGLNLLF